jgi:hypothetical protein
MSRVVESEAPLHTQALVVDRAGTSIGSPDPPGVLIHEIPDCAADAAVWANRVDRLQLRSLSPTVQPRQELLSMRVDRLAKLGRQSPVKIAQEQTLTLAADLHSTLAELPE